MIDKENQNKNNRLDSIALQYNLPSEDVMDIHQKFKYRLNIRLDKYIKEDVINNENYAVDLTARYYRIKLGNTNHDEIISKWRIEGSEIKYFRDWPQSSSKANNK